MPGVALLLQSGANVNSQSQSAEDDEYRSGQWGKTAADGTKEVLRRDDGDCTALHMAIDSDGPSADMVKLLLAHDAGMATCVALPRALHAAVFGRSYAMGAHVISFHRSGRRHQHVLHQHVPAGGKRGRLTSPTALHGAQIRTYGTFRDAARCTRRSTLARTSMASTLRSQRCESLMAHAISTHIWYGHAPSLAIISIIGNHTPGRHTPLVRLVGTRR